MIQLAFSKKLHSINGPMILDISATIGAGTFVSVYGKSGAGKTTLLKILAGISNPDGGLIKVNSELWFHKDKCINTNPQKRNIGFVFQDYALFPNMTVEENLKFVLSNKNEKKTVSDLVELLGLGGLKLRYPYTLSGGQQQRVAIARALVRKPSLLLLDEPLSSLDHETRYQLQEEIVKLHRHYKLTTLMVSHDLSEIYRLSDQVIELSSGKIVRQGSPADVFQEKQLTGKFQLVGSIVDIKECDIVIIVKIISGNNIIKVVNTREEGKALRIGDQVLICSKAFNPVLLKI
jgi:molybdate transport system ATP-binding protein